MPVHLHPENLLLVARQRVTGYHPHNALHRAEAEELLRTRRREAWKRRLFFLRYRLRSLMYRFAPGLDRWLTI